MNLLDYTWSTVEFITAKSPNEIKVVIDETDFPSIEQDSSTLHVSSPKCLDETFSLLHGIRFDNNLSGRTDLWRMFRASVCHLSLHTYASNFEIYKEWMSKENRNNAVFAMSLAEDYALRSVMRTLWPGLLVETGHVNYRCHLCLKPPRRESDLALRVAANFLSYSLTGKNLEPLGGSLDEQIKSAHLSLRDFSDKMRELYESAGRYRNKNHKLMGDSETANAMRLKAANSILSVFRDNHLRLTHVPAVPYTEHYGKENALFGDLTPASESLPSSLEDSFAELGLRSGGEELEENDWALRSEAEAVLGDWEHSSSIRKRLIETYTRSETLHFESFGFPGEDFAEFVRIRSRLIGRIRCALDLLRMAKTSIEELTAQEFGFIDVPLAIQIIASKSNSTDVYFRDEAMVKRESWAILIDSSKSLQRLICAVKDATVCLTEIADGMLPGPESWACYTFNENFNIIKDFSEPYTNQIRARVGGIDSGLKTFLPDAIKLASSRLQQTQSDLKVMVVVSDGYPQGYEGIDKELLRVVEEVNSTGIVLIGIGVTSSAISKYFRTTMVAHNAYDLMKDFVNMYYEIVSSAL